MSRNIIKNSLIISISAILAIIGLNSSGKQEEDLTEEYDETVLSENIGFNVVGEPESAASGLKTYYDDSGNCYFDVYLPWDKEKELGLISDKNIEVTIDNKTYRDGDRILPPAMEFLNIKLTVPGIKSQTGSIRFINTSGLPSVHLVTTSESVDYLTEAKGNTAEGACTILDQDGNEDFFGNCDIRVHGNTSWYFEKRSYQFNLDNAPRYLECQPRGSGSLTLSSMTCLIYVMP